MSIDVQLYLLSGGLTFLALFAAYQAFALSRIYRSHSSWVGSLAFVLLGSRQAFSFLRLRANIADARMKGVMIDRLSPEQWLAGVVWAFAIIICFIVWLHLQRRDLKELGV